MFSIVIQTYTVKASDDAFQNLKRQYSPNATTTIRPEKQNMMLQPVEVVCLGHEAKVSCYCDRKRSLAHEK
jgi:hypothetical protein